MTGRVKFPSYLYVRVDKPLRAALVCAAEAQGITVSDLARRELRRVLTAEGRLTFAAKAPSNDGR